MKKKTNYYSLFADVILTIALLTLYIILLRNQCNTYSDFVTSAFLISCFTCTFIAYSYGKSKLIIYSDIIIHVLFTCCMIGIPLCIVHGIFVILRNIDHKDIVFNIIFSSVTLMPILEYESIKTFIDYRKRIKENTEDEE